MKDTITVRKESYEHLKNQFRAFDVIHTILRETDESYHLEVEFTVLQQFYAASALGAMAQAFDYSEAYLKNELRVKPFSESELTQL